MPSTVITLPPSALPARVDVTVEFEEEGAISVSLSCGPVQTTYLIDCGELLDMDVQLAGNVVASLENLEIPIDKVEEIKGWIAAAETYLDKPSPL